MRARLRRNGLPAEIPIPTPFAVLTRLSENDKEAVRDLADSLFFIRQRLLCLCGRLQRKQRNEEEKPEEHDARHPEQPLARRHAAAQYGIYRGQQRPEPESETGEVAQTRFHISVERRGERKAEREKIFRTPLPRFGSRFGCVCVDTRVIACIHGHEPFGAEALQDHRQ